jgi:hypothetical protein
VQKKIAQKLEATERFVNLGCIALGLLQILALKHPRLIWKNTTAGLEPSDAISPPWMSYSRSSAMSIFLISTLSEKQNCIE